MWTITDAKGNERGRFDTEADAWKEYDRLCDLAGCMGPYRVQFSNSLGYCRVTGGSDRRCA